jgi:hypothetical protein
MQILKMEFTFNVRQLLCVGVIFVLLLYGLWEGYWYQKVGLSFVKWHTHLIFYIYPLFIFLLLFQKTNIQFLQKVLLSFMTTTLLLLSCESFFLLLGINTSYIEKSTGSYVSFYNEKNASYYHVWPPYLPRIIEKPEYKYPRPSNSLGFPDKEWQLKKNTTLRILALGDSFTEGDGAPQDSCYPSLLSDILNTGSLHVEIMNAGTLGSDPFFNYINYKDRLQCYKPDIILQSISSGDIVTDVATRGGLERFVSNKTLKFSQAPWWEPIYAISNISRSFFFVLGYNTLLQKREVARNQINQYNKKIKELFYMYDSLARQNNTTLCVVVRPDKMSELINDSSDFDFTPIINDLKKSTKIHFINSPKTKTPCKLLVYKALCLKVVVWEGIEPPTHRFSVYCSTD